MRSDVLPCGGHPHPSLLAAANGAVGQLGALAEEQGRRLRAALVHRAGQWTAASRQGANNPVSSKNQVENHTLQSRGAYSGERTRT